MSLPENYLDMTHREELLQTVNAQHLKNKLPIRIYEFLREYFVDDNQANSKDLADYFIKHSCIFNIIKSTPGSSIGYDCLYTKNTKTELDNYFVQCISGHQIYERLKSLEQKLPRLIRSKLNEKQSLLVDNIGSGVGRDMINVVFQNPDIKNKLHVRQIDPDSEALNLSRKIAYELGVVESFSFHENSLSSIDSVNADVVLLIGMLCPLNLRHSSIVLRQVKRLCNSNNGLLIFSTATHNMVIDDPLTDSLMRLCGWNMSFKTESDSTKLAESLGLKIIEVFYEEPYHHHCMIVAQT
jgi:hypothetical protein